MKNDEDFEEFFSYMATHDEEFLFGKDQNKKYKRSLKLPAIGCSVSTFLHLLGLAFIIFTFAYGSGGIGLLIIVIYLIFL